MVDFSRGKAQYIAWEYIMLASLILIAGAVFLWYASTESQKAIADTTLGNARETLVGVANDVCISGVGSKETVKIRIPSLYEAQLFNKTVNLRYRYGGKVSDYEGYTDCNVTGSINLTEGVYDVYAYHVSDGLVQIGMGYEDIVYS